MPFPMDGRTVWYVPCVFAKSTQFLTFPIYLHLHQSYIHIYTTDIGMDLNLCEEVTRTRELHLFRWKLLIGQLPGIGGRHTTQHSIIYFMFS